MGDMQRSMELAHELEWLDCTSSEGVCCCCCSLKWLDCLESLVRLGIMREKLEAEDRIKEEDLRFFSSNESLVGLLLLLLPMTGELRLLSVVVDRDSRSMEDWKLALCSLSRMCQALELRYSCVQTSRSL